MSAPTTVASIQNSSQGPRPQTAYKYKYKHLRRWGTRASLQTTALLQRADTLLAVFFTRGRLHVSPAEPDLLSDHLARGRIEYPCQNCTAMGCIWARVGQLNRLMTVPLPEAELNSHAWMAMGCTWVRAQVNRGGYPLQTMIVPLPEAELNSHSRRIGADARLVTVRRWKNDEKQIAGLHAKVLLSAEVAQSVHGRWSTESKSKKSNKKKRQKEEDE